MNNLILDPSNRPTVIKVHVIVKARCISGKGVPSAPTLGHNSLERGLKHIQAILPGA